MISWTNPAEERLARRLGFRIIGHQIEFVSFVRVPGKAERFDVRAARPSSEQERRMWSALITADAGIDGWKLERRPRPADKPMVVLVPADDALPLDTLRVEGAFAVSATRPDGTVQELRYGSPETYRRNTTPKENS